MTEPTADQWNATHPVNTPPQHGRTADGAHLLDLVSRLGPETRARIAQRLDDRFHEITDTPRDPSRLTRNPAPTSPGRPLHTRPASRSDMYLDAPLACPLPHCDTEEFEHADDLRDHLLHAHEPEAVAERLAAVAADIPYHRHVDCQRCGTTGARPGDHPLCCGCETAMGHRP